MASALYDRLSADVVPPHRPGSPGSRELFARDGADAGDADLTAAIDVQQLACLAQGLRWLVTLLREPVLQVSNLLNT